MRNNKMEKNRCEQKNRVRKKEEGKRKGASLCVLGLRTKVILENEKERRERRNREKNKWKEMKAS